MPSLKQDSTLLWQYLEQGDATFWLIPKNRQWNQPVQNLHFQLFMQYFEIHR